MVVTTSLLYPKNKRQQRVNDFWRCILKYPKVVSQHKHGINVLAAFVGKFASNDSTTTL